METNRLLIRNFTINDAQACFNNWGQDKGLGRYLPMFPMKSAFEMENLVLAFSENPNVWLIEEKSAHEPMGYLTMDIAYEFLGIGELGYVIGEKYQHKGYASEAVSAILSYLFIERNLYMVEAKYNETNEASEKLLSRLGFQKDGVLRGRRIDSITGERSNLVVCSITRDEFIR